MLPTICNIEDGPSGLAYYLGTGLNASCFGRIFITPTPDPLCDFCGLGSVPAVRCMGVKWGVNYPG